MRTIADCHTLIRAPRLVLVCPRFTDQGKTDAPARLRFNAIVHNELRKTA
jgi:hypothetical protein